MGSLRCIFEIYSQIVSYFGNYRLYGTRGRPELMDFFHKAASSRRMFLKIFGVKRHRGWYTAKGRDVSEQRGKLGYSNAAAVKLICSPDYKNGRKIHK